MGAKAEARQPGLFLQGPGLWKGGKKYGEAAWSF